MPVSDHTHVMLPTRDPPSSIPNLGVGSITYPVADLLSCPSGGRLTARLNAPTPRHRVPRRPQTPAEKVAPIRQDIPRASSLPHLEPRAKAGPLFGPGQPPHRMAQLPELATSWEAAVTNVVRGGSTCEVAASTGKRLRHTRPLAYILREY